MHSPIIPNGRYAGHEVALVPSKYILAVKEKEGFWRDPQWKAVSMWVLRNMHHLLDPKKMKDLDSSDIVVLDLETTAIDINSARIVQISALQMEDNGINQLINPGIPIPKDATAVHNIHDADVETMPTFAQFAATLSPILDGKVLVGYNIKKYDLPVLINEYARNGKVIPEWRAVIDCMLWMQKEEARTLGWTYRYYTGDDPDEAELHDASYDTWLTARVFEKQLEAYTDKIADLTPTQVEDYIRHPYLDDGRKFIQLETGEIAITFGKHVTDRGGQPVPILNLPPDYVDWMLKNFNSHEVSIIKAAFR